MIIEYADLGTNFYRDFTPIINIKIKPIVNNKNEITIATINNAIRIAKKKYQHSYTSVFFFKGNFEASFWYFWDIYTNPPSYDLLNHNCLHVATAALNKGICTGNNREHYQEVIKLLTKETVPNYAYKALKFFFDNFEKYYRSTKMQRRNLKSPFYYFGKFGVLEKYL